jgi:hypothetical protein
MVNTYNFLPRTSTIDKIVQKYYFLVSGKPTSRNNSWAFLKSEFLVVPVYSLRESSSITEWTKKHTHAERPVSCTT